MSRGNSYYITKYFATGIPIFIFGILLGVLTTVNWSKPEVTAVVLVKPGIGGFVPVEGSAIGNTWNKNQVTPVLLVKPGIGGFVPREGSAIGNTWRKNDVKPVMLVEPSLGRFVPLGILADNTQPATDASTTYATPAVIESRIDGEFTGWTGQTIFKLQNGQIWQQASYAYRYRYAYSPKVIIYRSGQGYQMKVDGIDQTIHVKRLR